MYDSGFAPSAHSTFFVARLEGLSSCVPGKHMFTTILLTFNRGSRDVRTMTNCFMTLTQTYLPIARE